MVFTCTLWYTCLSTPSMCFFHLIDINKKNGGTDFYIGSHKFHKDNKDNCRVSRIWFECEFRQAKHVLLTKVSLNILGHLITCQSRSTNHLWLPPRVSTWQNNDNIYCCFVSYVPWLHKVHYMPTNLQALGYWEYHRWYPTNIENTTDEIWPMLYLTYSGVCSDGGASFCNFKNFTKLYQSLEAEIGLVPDHPDRGNRAEHGAIQLWKSWKILLQVDNRRKNNTLKTPATCKGILPSLLMCPTSWRLIVFNFAKLLK